MLHFSFEFGYLLPDKAKVEFTIIMVFDFCYKSVNRNFISFKKFGFKDIMGSFHNLLKISKMNNVNIVWWKHIIF